MLEHLGFDEAAKCMTDAIDTALAEDGLRTADLGGKATTKTCGAAVADIIAG
jgi:tartrate dehydrogenase/decarboxylase/D-malate dehydrogenase